MPPLFPSKSGPTGACLYPSWTWLPTLYKNLQICTISEIFSSVLIPLFILHPFPVFLGQCPQQFTSLKGGLYGYFADRHTSVVRARNSSLSSLQGFSASSERRIFDLSDLQSGDYTTGALTGGA